MISDFNNEWNKAALKLSEEIRRKRMAEDTNKVIVTARDDVPPVPVVLPTPAGTTDIEVVPMSIWAQVLIRTLRSYIQNVLGYLLGAGIGVGVANAAVMALAAAGVDVPPATRTFLEVLLAALSAAVGPSFVCLLQNTLEMLAKWDVTKPELRA